MAKANTKRVPYKPVRATKVFWTWLPPRKCDNDRYQMIPSIRVSGKWLESAGFKPHDPIVVHVHRKKLVITH